MATGEVDVMEVVRRPVVHGVKLSVAGREPLAGSLCVSAFLLLYSTRRHEGEEEITMLNTAIESVEHKANSPLAVLHLRDFRQLSLEFPSPEEAQDMVDALETLCRPSHLHNLYAFHHHPSRPLPPPTWHFSTAHDLLRHWHCNDKDTRWRVSSVNKDFRVCPSYPEEVIVPQSCSDESLLKVAEFRHLGRFPIVAYHHMRMKAVIMRCSQPRVGPAQKNRCREDAQLLQACLPSVSKGKILDTRSPDLAQAHMSKGGGMELPAHYPQWKLDYGKMDSLAGLAASLARLREACMDPSLSSSASWYGRVESSGWLSHVTRLMNCAKFVARCVHQDGTSVVVHGAAGTDTTIQVTSLAQVLLDPHCRTLSGFADLIQREWLDGGHPFSLRHGHASSAPDKERSPVFLLFLDAVWQVTQQFPLSFEFNERFLHKLYTHSYYSEYGTFLYDNPRERWRNRSRTHSLWSHLSQPEVTQHMMNPLYEKNSGVLQVSVGPLTVTLWQRLYLRTGLEETIALPGLEAKARLRERNSDLKRQLQTVRQQLSQLQAQGKQLLAAQSS